MCSTFDVHRGETRAGYPVGIAQTMTVLSRFLVIALCCIGWHAGQGQAAEAEDPLRSVIVVLRHGVRAPIESEIRGSVYNAQPWPAWPVAAGVLTKHGADALKLLGEYYRLRYQSLFADFSCGNPGIYVEANTTQRTVASAKSMLSGLAPECNVTVHSRPHSFNPLFSPSRSNFVDQKKLLDATDGRIGNRMDWFAHSFAAPMAQMRQVLLNCSSPSCAGNKADFRAVSVANGAISDSSVAIGADFSENFLLQYTEGMPMDQVGWGRVSRDQLDSFMEMNTRYHDFALRTPYFAQVAASDLAVKIRDTALGASGRLGTVRDRIFFLVGHDSNLSWLGGLLRLDWILPDQTFNATPPGSALVFEIRQKTVRVLFVSQTLDQIRYLRREEPSVAPVFVPGCSGPGPEYACSVKDFARVISAAVDMRFVE
jgi:4-phytase / acid phosphatase